MSRDKSYKQGSDCRCYIRVWKGKEYFTFRYKNQQNLTKLKSEIEIVNWAELPAHNDPSQACRNLLQKYTATIYNRCFYIEKNVKVKGIACWLN